jgi:hypothetical protein
MQQHWSGYLNAVAGHKTPNTTMPTAAPYETSSSEKGATGFMDLIVKQPKIQAKYDAMQGTWEGPAASEAATANNVFKTESMPINQKNYGKK